MNYIALAILTIITLLPWGLAMMNYAKRYQGLRHFFKDLSILIIVIAILLMIPIGYNLSTPEEPIEFTYDLILFLTIFIGIICFFAGAITYSKARDFIKSEENSISYDDILDDNMHI